jgi:LysM repeat protein
MANVVVKPGETLSEIADRNGVSLKRLMQANGLTDPSKLAIGQTLVIPGGRQGSGSSNSSLGISKGGTITVRDGDTLSGIADRAGISVNRLMRLNGISDPDKLTVGQTLVVRGSGGSGYSSQAAAAKPLPTAPYTVKKGETVSELAERFGTTTNRLLQLNNISDPKLLVAGKRIAIPGRPSSAASSPISSSGTAGASKTSEYVVQSGESLSHIADRHNTSVDRLVALNKLADPDFVVAGTRIKLQAPPAPKPAPKQATKPAPKPKPQPKPAVQTAAKPKPAATVQTAAKPVVETKPVVATKPVAEAKPVVETKPVAVAKPVVATKPVAEAKPVVASQPATTTATAVATSTTVAKPVATTPSPKAEAQPAQTTPAQTTTVASRPRAASTSRTTAKLASADWRNYGPLQVDWANWQSMGGSYVAPTLNGKGQPLYLAINCGARKLNTTNQSGQWKSWEAPQADFEEQLVSDLCKAKGG